jgi:hypothetical protein
VTVGHPTAGQAADPSAAPARPSRLGRFVDRGAIFAGYVGIGMAVVIAIAFELIIPVQTLVFIAAPISGVLIGAYANQRSLRWRPMKRVFANALWAAVVTAVSLALIYGTIRMLFVYADSGFRNPGQGGQITCQTGPDCTWKRYLEDGKGPELIASGVTDGRSFGSYFLVNTVIINGAGLIIMLTVGGALIAAGFRSIQTPPADLAEQIAAADR